MKFLHWNVHGWVDTNGDSNIDRIIAAVRREEPDCVSLVEIDEPWGRPDNIEHVARQLGYHWAFIPAFEYRGQGGFGNALLSQEPLGSVQQWQLLPATTYDGTEPSEPRACLLATTTTPSGPVTIGSTHLPRAQDSSRKHATERLLELLQTITGPLLVFGDFNQPPNAWLEEQTFLTTPAPQATYPADNPTEAIDYCVAAATTITKSIILNDNGSDHKAVLVTTR